MSEPSYGGVWTMANIFISYSAPDQASAQRLAEALRDEGHEVWFDLWEINVGDSIIARINEGLRAASYVIIVYSSATSNSWVDRESMAALSRQLRDAQVRILPVRLTGGRVPSILADMKFADLATDWQQGLALINEAINAGAASPSIQPAENPPETPRISSFGDTGSIQGDTNDASTSDILKSLQPSFSIPAPAVGYTEARPFWRAFTDGLGGIFDIFGGIRNSRGRNYSGTSLAEDAHALCVVLGLVADDSGGA